MSQFKANENYAKHVSDMDYTAIKNMQAKALDENDWDKFDAAHELEKQWLAAQ